MNKGRLLILARRTEPEDFQSLLEVHLLETDNKTEFDILDIFNRTLLRKQD
jgi:hypothetical protein